jgi:outer membrane immunogenic protein
MASLVRIMVAAGLALVGGFAGGSTGAAAQARPDMWAGVYTGVNLGAARNGTASHDQFSVGSDFRGATFGGYVGYNAQSGRFVYGVEAEAAAQLGESSKNYQSGAVVYTYKDSTPALGSFRGRLGYAHGALLVYGVAGISVGLVKSAYSHNYTDWTGVARRYSDDLTQARGGLVVGAGAEFMASSSISLRVEALSYSQTRHNEVRGGLSYHFN